MRGCEGLGASVTHDLLVTNSMRPLMGNKCPKCGTIMVGIEDWERYDGICAWQCTSVRCKKIWDALTDKELESFDECSIYEDDNPVCN